MDLEQIKAYQQELEEAGHDPTKVTALQLKIRLDSKRARAEYELKLEAEAQEIYPEVQKLLDDEDPVTIGHDFWVGSVPSREFLSHIAKKRRPEIYDDDQNQFVRSTETYTPTHLVMMKSWLWLFGCDPLFEPLRYLPSNAKTQALFAGDIPVIVTEEQFKKLHTGYVRWTNDSTGEVAWSEIYWEGA